MNPLSLLYQELLVRPLYNLLVGTTNLLPTHDVGIAIILVTLIVRLLLLPPAVHQARQLAHNQQKMAAVQRELASIRKRFKADRSRQAQETMAVYHRAGINPASGCLPALIQLPILIALYQVFLRGLGPDTYAALYPFVSAPNHLDLMFLGVNVTTPSVTLAVLSGVAQYILMRYFTPAPTATPTTGTEQQQMMASMQRNMLYIFPAMMVFISLRIPAALPLYWVASTVFAAGQQYIIQRRLKLQQPAPLV